MLLIIRRLHAAGSHARCPHNRRKHILPRRWVEFFQLVKARLPRPKQIRSEMMNARIYQAAVNQRIRRQHHGVHGSAVSHHPVPNRFGVAFASPAGQQLCRRRQHLKTSSLRCFYSLSKTHRPIILRHKQDGFRPSRRRQGSHKAKHSHHRA